MKTLLDYINSGILEVYVLGGLDADEIQEVENMADKHPEVKRALEAIQEQQEQVVQSLSTTPSISTKASILATLDFKSRLSKGEQLGPVPLLSPHSAIEDFTPWTSRPDLQLPEDADEIYAKIIGYTAEVTTMLVWLKYGAPPETHTTELESFFILEGSCYIHVEKETVALSPGMFFQIPLFKSHRVEVTSPMPCKVVLERRAS